MSEINDEMRVTADYAISTAKDRYGMELDYSEESLSILDTILEKIYWGFSSHNKDEGQGGLIYNAAIIWGSYLGEYMRLKWGGTWILKDSERRISITSIEFSPINFIFQRITNHPEYRVTNFIQETKKAVYTSVIHPKQSQYVSTSAGQPDSTKKGKVEKKPFKIDKRIVYATGGVLGILVIIFACITASTLIKSGGIPAFGASQKSTGTPTSTLQPTVPVIATLDATGTGEPTATLMPTYTPKPTETPRPTNTPIMTGTPLPTWTPTPTETPSPTETEIPYQSPTPSRTVATNTAKPPTKTRTPTAQPSPTNTPQPTFTNTSPPQPTFTNTVRPPEIVSCGVSPSTVPAGVPTDLNFSVQFTDPGYGMQVTGFNPQFPGQSGCSDPNNDGNNSASCTGSSGLVSAGSTIHVTISTGLGSCSVTYKGQ
jgi:hypothetical protein